MRKRQILLTSALILCALIAGLYLRWISPPEPARLLPESDAIVFFNLKPLRAATHFDRNPPPPSPEYKQFIDATGIVLERDLNQAAFALHRMPNPSGPNGPVAFSEVLQGSFDTPRLTRYLSSQSNAQELYAGFTIYSIPSSQGYTDRIAILDAHTVAASNAPTPEQIHAIIDLRHAAASPFAGPSLLRALYPGVPAFSPAWAIGRIGLPFSDNNRISLAGLDLPLPADTSFIASLRYTNALHLQIDQLTASEADATQSAQTLTNLLTLFRKLQQSPTPELTQLLDSISIQPHKDRATLTATIPTDLLKHLTNPVTQGDQHVTK